MISPPHGISFNFLTLFVFLIGIVLIYFLSLIVQNSYVTFSPKSMAIFSIFSFLLGALIVMYEFGLYEYTVLLGFASAFFAAWFLLRGHKNTVKRKLQTTNGGNVK